jgi:hypothetical protein
MRWVAFFSQTGKEIHEVSKRLGRWPDLCVTTTGNFEINPEFHAHLLNSKISFLHYMAPKPSIACYVDVLGKSINTIVTLNGWLKILPAAICNRYEIYNGHPGLITKYPQLKGKDPQLKAINLQMDYSGCVIHDVTEEIDGGKIRAEREIPIFGLSREEVFSHLHDTSIDLWVEFLEKRFKQKIMTPCTCTDEIRKEIENAYPETCEYLRTLMEEEYALFMNKQHDYGAANISVGQNLDDPAGRRVALSAIIFRMNDKVQRLLNLVVKKGELATCEPVEDAFRDIGLFAKIALTVDKNKWAK